MERVLFGENPSERYTTWRLEFREAHEAYWGEKGSTKPASPLCADSDEVAHLFRFEAAHHSDFISPMIPR